MSVKRKCICCGREYEYCPNCAQKNQPAWMVTFCNETCKDLFNVVSAYNMNRIGRDKVQAFAAEHNITSANYSGSINKVLEEAGIKSANPEQSLRNTSSNVYERPKDEDRWYLRRRKRKHIGY
jgi:hypothetical protein